MTCGVPLHLRLFWVRLGWCPPKTSTFVRCTSGKSPLVYNVLRFLVNIGSKPWNRCGRTDDTPRRLGDAGIMTFLPWFVPLTEPPVQLRAVQLREVGPDREHIHTESCNEVSDVSMSWREPGLLL